MNHIKIDKLRIRLKNVSPEAVRDALPEAWIHLKRMISRTSFSHEATVNRDLSLASLRAGKIESHHPSNNFLPAQIAENIYRSINPVKPVTKEEGHSWD